MDNTELIGYRWTPITDLPERRDTLASPDLASFAPIWLEHRQTLQGSEALREFTSKLQREWSIETGIIEHTYTLDRGITLTLINSGFREDLIPHGATDKQPAFLVRILKDHESVINGVFDFIAQRRQLSISYIRELHQAITMSQKTTEAVDQFGNVQDIELLKGEWKKLPNNPTRPDGLVHQYCPPEQVASEMDRLVELHLLHQAAQVPPEVEAAWLHHRFTQIHPFQDGNGRVARTLASLVLVQADWFPLIIDRDARAAYLNASEAADNGDLAPLTQMFSKQQVHCMRRAVSLAEDALTDRPVYQVLVEAATERLRKQLQQRDLNHLNAVSLLAKRFLENATGQFNNVSGEITRELKTISGTYFSDVQQSTDDNEHWFIQQVVQIAKHFGYYADTSVYRAWIRLRIRWERQAEIVLSIHSLGRDFVGVLALSAFLLYRDKDQENGTSVSEQIVWTAVSEPVPLTGDIFQFSYRDDFNEFTPRFRQWLEQAIVVALEHWREQL